MRISHIYARTVVLWCEVIGIGPLSALLSEGSGRVFCSIEELEPCPEVYDEERVTISVTTPGIDDLNVALEFTTNLISSDTTRMELAQGSQQAVVAVFNRTEGRRLIFRPLVIGAPWLSSEDEALTNDDAMWWAYHYYEDFIEDIDEFAKAAEVEDPDDFSIMRRISESAFKQCLAELLGDSTRSDWGGERSDHFTAHIHLRGRRMTAAFLLKGPAQFRPMTLDTLGKKNDQIYRLSQEPAELLVVQHCHDIEPPVRATLRAFTVQPGRKRRYCLIDGRDSLRLLRAYDLVERALELSR